MPESDADHSFSLAMLVLLLTPEGINRCHCLELALTHDLAEIYAGDPTPDDQVSPKQKYCRERAGVIRLAKELNWPLLIDLFEEYSAVKTKEAIFVNALDKIDNVVTAAYYDHCHRSPNNLLSEFACHTELCLANLNLDEVKEIKNILQLLKN